MACSRRSRGSMNDPLCPLRSAGPHPQLRLASVFRSGRVGQPARLSDVLRTSLGYSGHPRRGAFRGISAAADDRNEAAGRPTTISIRHPIMEDQLTVAEYLPGIRTNSSKTLTRLAKLKPLPGTAGSKCWPIARLKSRVFRCTA